MWCFGAKRWQKQTNEHAETLDIDRCRSHAVSSADLSTSAHRQRFLVCCSGLAWSIAIAIGWLSVELACAKEDKPRQSPVAKVDAEEFVATVLEPFWRTTEIREPIFFVEGVGSDRPRGKLLFKPIEILSVTSGTRRPKFRARKRFHRGTREWNT